MPLSVKPIFAIKINMATKKYHLHLRGFVGGYDFDAEYVNYILAQNENTEVNVLIDSLGGRVDTALSICEAFRRHGNVTVHYVGMNASAATIAGLGAKRITIASSAMYLVHKCSNIVFKWASLNADQLADYIADLQKQKKDQEFIDANIAAMYSAKCKKERDTLLELMSEGGWLSAELALEWGFVDEIIDTAEKVQLTEGTITAMMSAGIPIPKIEKEKTDSFLSKVFASLHSIFAPEAQAPTKKTNTMKKKFHSLCALLALEMLTFAEGLTSLDENQVQSIEDNLSSLNNEIDALKKQIVEKDARIAELEAAPGGKTTAVVDNGKNTEKSASQEFFENMEECKKMFHSI